jgi:hypothetical protein
MKISRRSDDQLAGIPTGNYWAIYASGPPGPDQYATLLTVEPDREDDGKAAETAAEAMASTLSVEHPGIRYTVEHVSALPHRRRTSVVWFGDGQAHERRRPQS